MNDHQPSTQDRAEPLVREHLLEAVFPDKSSVPEAVATLERFGIDQGNIRIVDPPTRKPAPRAETDDESEPGALEQIGHALTESFSDDEKFLAELETARAASSVILQAQISGHEDARAELGRLLREKGATAVYYWGVLTTERL